MAVLVHAVPQWQGALWDGAAVELPAGCHALAGLVEDVTGVAARTVPVDGSGSPVVGGVGNRRALVANRRAQLDGLEAPGEHAVLTLGGDCSVDLVPVGVARFRHGERLGVVWFDAHADLNTARSSPSGAYHGMVLRSLLGQGDREFAADPALAPGRAVLVGARALDSAERDAVDEGLVRWLPVSEAAAVGEELRAAGVDRVYVHVDLDVLDPDVVPVSHYREPGGLGVGRLTAALDSLGDFEVVGAAVTECTATRPELDVVAPVVESLARLLDRPTRAA